MNTKRPDPERSVSREETVGSSGLAAGVNTVRTQTWRWRLLPVVCCLLILVPRLAAVSFNIWPHGDVLLDAAVTDSMVERGELKVPLVDVRFYPTGRFGFGYPPDQHPPLWPTLGAVVRLGWRDSYEALKLVSLAAGLLLIPAVYVCGRDIFGPNPARFAAALCSVSYLLIDFSGNGSLWGLLALLYVLFVWRAACFRLDDRRNAIILGALMGLAYLTNYPAIVLPATFTVLLAVRLLTNSAERGCGSAGDILALPPARSVLAGSTLALAVAALLVVPWLAFNVATFQNPIWSQPLERQLGGGDKQVEVVVHDGQVVKRTLPSPDPLGNRLRTTVQNVYGNVGFLARQSFVLMPFWEGFTLAGLLILVARTFRGKAGRALPLVLLTLAHSALVLLWPTTKFRYLVPLFPLVALIGSWLLWQIKPPELRRALAAVAVGLSCFTSLWTFAAIPSHTYYYDGGAVGDNFGGQGEAAYVEELRHLEQAAEAIRAAGPGTVLGPHPLYAMARQPLVINSDDYSRDVVEHLVGQYAIRYVVAPSAHLPFYAEFLPGQPLWQDERFGVYLVSADGRR